MFKDLFTYEIILLLLGAVMFLAFLVLAVIMASKERPIKQYLVYIGIAVLMMAYPGIQSMTISKDKLELSKAQDKMMEDPDNEETIEQVAELTKDLENRVSTKEDHIRLIKSYIMLDEPDKALAAVNSARASGVLASGSSAPFEAKLNEFEKMIEAMITLESPGGLSSAEKEVAVAQLNNSVWLNNNKRYKREILERYTPVVMEINPQILEMHLTPIDP